MNLCVFVCECLADLCLVAGCGDISSNVLCRMVHHAGSQGFGRCSLSSLSSFFFAALHQLFQVGTSDRDTGYCGMQFLWIALPAFNYTQVSSANHMVPVAFISIWMRTSKDRSKMIQAMQQRIACFFTKLFLLSYGRDRRIYRELTVLPHQCGCTPTRFVKIPATSSARVCTLEHQFLYSSLSCNMLSCCTLQALRRFCTTLQLGPSALFVQVANAIECWHCRCWSPFLARNVTHTKAHS